MMTGAQRHQAGSGSDDDLIANSNHDTWQPRFDSSEEDSDSSSAEEDGEAEEDEDEDDDANVEPADGHDADETLTTGLASHRIA